MNYSFKRSSEVYIVKDGLGYGVSALSNFSLSQTLSENTLNRRNLFKRIAPKQVINRTKNAGTGSLELYYTKNCPTLALLLESLDFEYEYNRLFRFKNIFSNIPKSLGLVVIDKVTGHAVNIKDVYVTNMDVQCSPTNISKITFGFSFTESYEGGPLAYLNKPVTPEYPKPEYIDFRLLNQQINSVKSAAFTITRSLRWLSDGATQFNLGKIASSAAPVVTEYNITSLVTANDNLDKATFTNLTPFNTDVIVGNNSFFLALPNARVTTRKEPAEVFTINFDIKHQSLSTVLLGGTYNGYIN